MYGSTIKRRDRLKTIWKKGLVKASLTVEASILIPFLLFVVAGGIKIGYHMFEEAKTVTKISKELDSLDPVDIVRTNTLIEGISAK